MVSLELSIIIPVLNEEAALDDFFDMLARQKDVAFEAVLVDGGSTDGTVSLAMSSAETAPFACRVMQSPRGRGRQLNLGARMSSAATLLFLHVDSRFVDPLALRRGLNALTAEIAHGGNDRVAGHYGLRFAVHSEHYGFGYFFYECKARLDRPQCTHGDQGFLLRRSFFSVVGPFDETFSLLEDTRLAEEVRRQGRWVLLPAEIFTSARRFESEGLYERQLLNALIMNFAAIGWDDFFRRAPDYYRDQDLTRRLRLLPFLRGVRELLRPLAWRERFSLWYRTGSYVRPHAWQIAFALDVRQSFRQRQTLEHGATPWLNWFDRWYEPFTNHLPGRLAATGLVWLWFQWTFLRHLLLEDKADLELGGEI